MVSVGALTLVGLGGVLVRAGLTGRAPTDTIKELLGGSVSALPAGATVSGSAIGQPVGQQAYGGLAGAVMAFRDDKYSQALSGDHSRWSDGYSDCSSFVAKGFHALGITDCPANTIGFAAWGKLKSVPRAQVAAGDLLVKPGVHMAVATSNETAIGQQNRRTNVKTAGIDEIMYGARPFVCLRYVG